MCLLDLLWEMEGGWWVVEMACTCFGGFLLRDSNAESGHRKKNLSINHSVEALIQLKEGHQGLLKLHLHLRRSGKITCDEAFHDLLKSSTSFEGTW